jgi:hypothetical protein
MKTITRVLGLFAVVAMFIFLDACKAEKGEVGPIGATGAVGATGAKGDKGDTGATGAAGTANVIYSPWSVISINTGSSAPYTAEVSAPQITQDILDKGLVLSFFRNVSSLEVFPLPYSFPTSSTTTQEGYASYIVGKIKLRSNITLSSVGFRYVIIPGGVAGGRRAAVDYTDYEAVKKYYNLKD